MKEESRASSWERNARVRGPAREKDGESGFWARERERGVWDSGRVSTKKKPCLSESQVWESQFRELRLERMSLVKFHVSYNMYEIQYVVKRNSVPPRPWCYIQYSTVQDKVEQSAHVQHKRTDPKRVCRHLRQKKCKRKQTCAKNGWASKTMKCAELYMYMCVWRCCVYPRLLSVRLRAALVEMCKPICHPLNNSFHSIWIL